MVDVLMRRDCPMRASQTSELFNIPLVLADEITGRFRRSSTRGVVVSSDNRKIIGEIRDQKWLEVILNEEDSTP